MYEIAGERLSAAGIAPYEISNFGRAGFESRHNLKYWTRQPYLGFGVDAHSMLKSSPPNTDAVRFARQICWRNTSRVRPSRGLQFRLRMRWKKNSFSACV